MKNAFLIMIILVAGLPAECAGIADSRSQVIARVNGEVITATDMSSAFSRRHSGHTALLNSQFDKRWYLDTMIDNVLLIQEGYRLGFDNDEIVKKRVDAFTGAKAIDLLYQREIGNSVTVDDDEVRRVYETYNGRSFDAALIQISSAAQAELVGEQLSKGVSFSELAGRYSIHPSATKHGKIGLVSWAQLPEQLEAALFALKPGETAGPILTAQGFFFMRLISIKDTQGQKFEEMKDLISSVIAERIKTQLLSDFTAALRKKNHIWVIDKDLSQIAANDGDYLVATAIGTTILTAEEWSRMVVQRSRDNGAPVTSRQLLDEAVTRYVMELEARGRGFDQASEVLAEASRFEKELILRQVNELMVKRLSVTESESQSYYTTNPDDFLAPESVRLSHILVHSKEVADSLIEKLANGEEFSTLARKFSIDNSALSGGDIGIVTKGSIIEEINDVVFSLNPGERSPVITSRYGYHILMVVERLPRVPRPYGEVAEQIKELLKKEKNSQERKKWIETLRDDAIIRINRQALENLDF